MVNVVVVVEYAPFIFAAVVLFLYPSWLVGSRINALRAGDDLSNAIVTYCANSTKFATVVRLAVFNSAYVGVDVIRAVAANGADGPVGTIKVMVAYVVFVFVMACCAWGLLRFHSQVPGDVLTGREKVLGKKVKLNLVLSAGLILFTLGPMGMKVVVKSLLAGRFQWY